MWHKGAEPPPPIQAVTSVNWAGRGAERLIHQLEAELAQERQARGAADERAAALQTRLTAAEQEVAQLRRQIAHASARSGPLQHPQATSNIPIWRPQPALEIRGHEPSRRSQNEMTRDGRTYSPTLSQIYSTQTSSPPAHQPPPMYTPLSGAPHKPHPSSPRQAHVTASHTLVPSRAAGLENGGAITDAGRRHVHVRQSTGADAWSASLAYETPSPSASSPGVVYSYFHDWCVFAKFVRAMPSLPVVCGAFRLPVEKPAIS